MASVLLVGLEQQLQGHLKSRIAELSADAESTADSQQALGWISDNHEGLRAVVIGPDIDEPVRLAQRVHRVDRDIALLILSDDAHHEQVSRALQFTPFLGDYVTSHRSAETEEITATIEETLNRSRQRQHFRSTIASMNQQLRTLTTPHRISAVQYLDHLLDHAPTGVVALDSNGHIISSNRRAGEILDQRERNLLGISLPTVFGSEERERVQEFISQVNSSESEDTPGIFSRQRQDGTTQFISITSAALPMDSGGHGKLVILQDVTVQVNTAREREEALQLRDEFLSMAAHELKTPLTSVKGFVDLLGRRIDQGDWDQDRIIRLQGQLSTQVDRLELLVSDLLDVSRIQQGRLDPHFEPFDLASLANEVVQRFADDPNDNTHLKLICDAPEPVTGTWDYDRIDQVITNLVSNALKYSPDRGTVEIKVRSRGDKAEIIVSDQGIGIPFELQPRLFQPFIRGTLGGEVPGTGLGLHITARIVEQHNGSISVESTPGEGSTFTIVLPRDPRQVDYSTSETQHTATH